MRIVVSFLTVLAQSILACDPSGVQPAENAETFAESPVTAEETYDNAVVALTHDHRLYEAHLHALWEAGVTLVTMEMIVDNLEWRDGRRRAVPGAAGWRDRFMDAHRTLRELIEQSEGRYRIVTTPEEIVTAKLDGVLGIVIGTEGTLHLEGNLEAIDDFVALGWRKTELRWAHSNGFANGTGITSNGLRLVERLARAHVVMSTTHLSDGEQAQLVNNVNVPLLASHEYPLRTVHAGSLARLRATAATGGGNGVIAFNALGAHFGIGPVVTIDDYADLIFFNAQVLGARHIGLGPDFMPPEQNQFGYVFEPDGLKLFAAALIERGMSHEDVAGILGGNVQRLYQQVWDPTRGHFSGPARFKTCTHASTDPDCLAATQNLGQGDFGHRVLSCLNPGASGSVALHNTYRDGRWKFYNVAGKLVTCVDGSTVIAVWGPDEISNADYRLCADRDANGVCADAQQDGGNGTESTRAHSCGHPNMAGNVGLQLRNINGVWSFYNVAGRTVGCAPNSTWTMSWGEDAAGTARMMACEDSSTLEPCVLAASNGGAGTPEARALNCLHSGAVNAAHGAVGLQLAYVDGGWHFYDVSGRLRRCLAGSVLVAYQ